MANSNSFDWSNVVGAGIGALGNVIGGLSSNALSSQQMKEMASYTAKLNYKYWKKQMLNQPTFYRQGLESANYNPMLALGGMQSGNSNWSQMANPTTPDMSNIGSSTISNALAVKQQENQNRSTDANVEKTNAETQLTQSKVVTESFEQMKKQVETMEIDTRRQLNQKNIDWYETDQLRKTLDSLTNYKRMLNDYELGIRNVQVNSAIAGSQQMNAVTNAKDVNSQIDIRNQEKKIKQWEADHPYQSRILGGVPGALGSVLGATILKTAIPVRSNPVGFR